MTERKDYSDEIPGLGIVCAGGCGGRFSDTELNTLLTQAGLLGGEVRDSRTLVDHTTGDDASVFILDRDVAFISSVDVGRPVVDSAYASGQITAANALSDIYAMGGTPRAAQNILGWPRMYLEDGSAARMLMGGQDVLLRAGIDVSGGHTMNSDEPFYGLAVQGTAHPDHLITNDTGEPGLDLILTKPIGSGLASSAILDGTAEPRTKAFAIQTMIALNDVASRVAVEEGVRTGTDITGSGLLGHIHKITSASNCGAEIDMSLVPVIPGVLSLARNGLRTAAGNRNLAQAETYTTWSIEERAQRAVVTDPQTSGGLLLAVPNGEAFLSRLHKAGVRGAARIGRLTPGNSIAVRP